MINGITNALLWFTAISSGLLAGVYFAFSAFIMGALGRIEVPAGIAAMNAINNVILRSPFMPLFLASTLAALILTVIALFQWQQPGSIAIFSGGVIYLLGMFICTVAFNVPLNDALAVVDPSSTQGAEVWSRYLRDWTFWNHIRTIASILSTIVCIYALVIR
ncbi:anthrone oxygenase family protein [Ochrobactrum sp. RH2CCR150]|uniref:anthrone oxygenase family protein n=1 Tax=Ochrobactrum sp. RH2CCR150 TaxID=2587044 RepID=UPI0015FCDC4F|nr:putative membrane protein [Ochrobactrum sp. RH2CCR150]